MRYKRKPVTRDIVDALKGEDKYVVQRADGSIEHMSHETFERDYEPAKRDYVRKPKTKRTKKTDGQPA